MSDKPLKWSFDCEAASRVLDVLRECGPLKPKEIARELHRRGLLSRANVATVNRLLHDHLIAEAEQIAGGRWRAVRRG